MDKYERLFRKISDVVTIREMARSSKNPISITTKTSAKFYDRIAKIVKSADAVSLDPLMDEMALAVTSAKMALKQGKKKKAEKHLDEMLQVWEKLVW